jgi:CubicO group peptidase (beta-lactamase class C family)
MVTSQLEIVPRSAFSSSRMQTMRDTMERHVDGGFLPGLVMLVSKGNAEQFAVFGKLAFGPARSMSRDTIFRLASMTKPVTAVAAMMLVEECRLRLDDPVDDLLPELANELPGPARGLRTARRHGAREARDHAA